MILLLIFILAVNIVSDFLLMVIFCLLYDKRYKNEKISM
jgi:hypothetical protein